MESQAKSKVEDHPTMLILRGIAGHFAGRDWPRGALDETSAVEYAHQRGYVGEVLDVAGATGPKSRQVRMCLKAIRDSDDAPKNPPALYSNGSWELIYRRDPPAGHMAGPKVLLAELAPSGIG